eukprot:scaffold27011_cov33-Tisochrysis_lutea.AAC.2
MASKSRNVRWLRVAVRATTCTRPKLEQLDFGTGASAESSMSGAPYRRDLVSPPPCPKLTEKSQYLGRWARRPSVNISWCRLRFRPRATTSLRARPNALFLR